MSGTSAPHHDPGRWPPEEPPSDYLETELAALAALLDAGPPHDTPPGSSDAPPDAPPLPEGSDHSKPCDP